MKFTFRFLAILAAVTMAAPTVAQEDNAVSTAELFSSMISGNSGQGNATDFQNAAPRPDWGNPIFGEQMITVTHGAVILQRQHDNDSLLPLNGMAGLELDAILHLREMNLEFGWLGVFSGTATQYLPAFAGSNLPTTPPIIFGSNGLLATQYSSDLNSFEFNARLPASESLTGIIGLRYINLYETVHLTTSTVTDNLGWKTVTNNNLFGAQAGADMTLSRLGRFQINAVGKAGVYVNCVEQEGMLVAFPAPGAISIHDSNAKVAFLGELKLLGTYRFTDYLAVTAGYQALWFSNLALGQNQFSAIDFATGNGIHSTASPIFHGATIQAVVSW
jgi:hypothetical protein